MNQRQFILTALVFLQFLFQNAYANQVLTMDHVRIIAPKKNQIEKVKVRKSFHGKSIKSFETEMITTKPTEGNKKLQSYIKLILDKLNGELMSKIPPIKRSLMFRFQIQQSGSFDFLNARSQEVKIVEELEKYFQTLDQFPKIPANTGQKELQLEFNFKPLKK